MMAQRCRLKRRPQTTDQIPETESVSAEEAGANEEQEEPPAEVSNEGTEGNVEGEASTEGDVPAGDEGTASTTPDVVPSESPAAENAEPETPAPEAVETPAPEAVETPVPSDASNEAQEAPQAPANGLEEAGPAPAPSVSPVPSEEPVKVSYTVKYLERRPARPFIRKPPVRLLWVILSLLRLTRCRVTPCAPISPPNWS